MINKRIVTAMLLCGTMLGSVYDAHAGKAESSLEQRIINLEKQLHMLRAELKEQKEQASRKEEKSETDKTDTSGVKISMTPSPKIESSDGNFSFQPFGRIHTDYALFDDDVADHPTGASVRRARLGFKGRVAKDFGYKFEVDFGKGAVTVKDAYVKYSGVGHGALKIGQFKPFFGLEELTSSNDITFIERASPINAFVSGRQIGTAYGAGGDDWSFNAGLFNDALSVTSTDDEAWSLSSRATYAPVAEKNRVVHLGVSGNYRVPDSAADSARFRARAENNNASLRSVDTGTISGVDDVIAYGLEAAVVYDSLSLQGEYLAAKTDIAGGSDAYLSGYYAQASYLLTGESRPYKAKAGKFGRIKPKNPFTSGGGSGAWEIALRYSSLDLTDGSAAVTGGEMDNVTLGVNWYLNNNMRLMANYIMVNTDSNATTANDDPNIILLRAQADF